MPAAKSDKAPKDKDRDLRAEIEKSAKLVDDIAKPGETPAQPTSRPVIVGHMPMIKDDPMMKDKNDESKDGTGEDVPAKTHRAKSISPLGTKNTENTDTEPAGEGEKTAEDSESEKITVSVVSKRSSKAMESDASDTSTQEPTEAPSLEVSSATEEGEAPESPDASSTTEDAAEAPQPESENPEAENAGTEAQSGQAAEEKAAAEPEPEQSADDGPAQGVVDSLVEEANAKKDNQKKEDELALRAEEAEKLIASKEFFVPIGQVSRRRSNHRIFLGLIMLVVLAAAAVNFAVDAEAIDIGVNAVTDLL